MTRKRSFLVTYEKEGQIFVYREIREKNPTGPFCTSFDAVSKYIIDFNCRGFSFSRPSDESFNKHFICFCRVTKTHVAALLCINPMTRRLYRKRVNCVRRKMNRKNFMLSNLFFDGNDKTS